MKKASGNMYSFVTHTWNPVKGHCPYECSYCYVDRWGIIKKSIHLDLHEIAADLGERNFIFVCSGCDLFHPDVPDEWATRIIAKTGDYHRNLYHWHTKNPKRANEMFCGQENRGDILCVTIESDIIPEGVSKAPKPEERAEAMRFWEGRKMITVEPVMKFEPFHFADMLNGIGAEQVNIGADSGQNNLPEPTRGELEFLISRLTPHTKIHLKKNLRRILPESEFYEAF
jgi:DNA repair photolyase